MTYKLGVSANLTPEGSVHTTTFKRAIQLAIQQLLPPGGKEVEVIWENDHAHFEGGIQAAEKLLSAGVNIVVGHYASAAARGALPVYRKAGIPVLLPAATADSLTHDFRNAFRIARTDSALADYIFETIVLQGTYYRIAVQHDGSLHGQSMASVLTRRLVECFELVGLQERPDSVIFTGNYPNSLAFLKDFQIDRQHCPVYFTDDVVSPAIVNDTRDRAYSFSVFGYAPSYLYPGATGINEHYFRLFGEYPSTYFLETYAAMQVAVTATRAMLRQRDGNKVLSEGKWDTVLGLLSFKAGESNLSRFARWVVQDGHLIPVLNEMNYAR